MENSVTMSLEQDSGNLVTREVHFTIDVRNFTGTAVYPYLLMAANPHLSSPDITRVIVATGKPGTYRRSGWLNPRRWMVSHLERPESTKGRPGRKPNADGKDGDAVRLMQVNTHLSLRALVQLLKSEGITRKKDWVRQHRCDSLSVYQP